MEKRAEKIRALAIYKTRQPVPWNNEESQIKTKRPDLHMLMSYHLRQERDNRETILPPWHLIMLRMKKGGTKRYPAFGWFTRDWESLVLWLDTILRPTCHKKSNLSPQPLAWQLTGFWMMGVGGGGMRKRGEVFGEEWKGLLSAGRKPGDCLPEGRVGLTKF